MSLPGVNRRHLAAGDSMPPIKEDRVRLYNMKFCPYAQRTVLALAAKNIPADIVNINLKSKPEWFLERNPLGKVPTLEFKGKVVYDSSICNEWLDAVFPENPILPMDPFERAKQKMIVEKLSPLIGAMYGFLRGGDKSEEVLASALQSFEKELGNQDFLAGVNCSWADYILWPFLERIDLAQSEGVAQSLVLTPGKFPKLSAYLNRMKQRPEVKLAMQDYGMHAEFMKSYLKGEPTNYDVGKVEEY